MTSAVENWNINFTLAGVDRVSAGVAFRIFSLIIWRLNSKVREWQRTRDFKRASKDADILYHMMDKVNLRANSSERDQQPTTWIDSSSKLLIVYSL